MSDPPIQSPKPSPINDTGKETFTILETVPITIGRQTTSIYPKVHPLMSIAERAYAYHVTSTALKSLRLAPDVYLDNMGMYLDSNTVVTGLKFDFNEYFDENWTNMDYLTILSFHDTAGAVIANATMANDMAVLKPVQDGVIADCRPGDVRYVRLQLILDFRHLCTAATPSDNTTLRATYYIELPQATRAVNDGNGNPRNLTTFLGEADLRTLSVAQIQTDILAPVHQDGPINLNEAPFNVANAIIDDSEISADINRNILKLAIKTVETSIFEQLCPNYTNKPHAAVENIKQTYTDSEGNVLVHRVAQYFSIMNGAARTFAHQKVYPCDLCALFMAGLHPDIKSKFEELYPKHTDPHDRVGRVQRLALAEILKKATQAEESVLHMQTLVQRQMGSQVYNVNCYKSQCEGTLEYYKQKNAGYGSPVPSPSPPGSRTPSPTKPPRMGAGHTCHGCGDPNHTARNCPDKDKPGWLEKVKANAAKFRKEKGEVLTPAQKNRWRKRNPNFDDLPAKT